MFRALVAGPSHPDVGAGGPSLHLVFVIPCQSPTVNITVERATQLSAGRARWAAVAGGTGIRSVSSAGLGTWGDWEEAAGRAWGLCTGPRGST